MPFGTCPFGAFMLLDFLLSESRQGSPNSREVEAPASGAQEQRWDSSSLNPVINCPRTDFRQPRNIPLGSELILSFRRSIAARPGV